MMNKEFSIKYMLNCFPQVEIEKFIYTLLDENKELEEENKQLKEDYATTVQNNCYTLELERRIDKAIEYNEHLIRDAKYHLNLGHLNTMRKILKGDINE